MTNPFIEAGLERVIPETADREVRLLHIGVLREEFMDFCDSLNLDAILEPVKS